MFCLMDVSGSMGEREKDLAKRFFVLLHLFLKRRYKKVDIVFIRHTHDAQEVDEQDILLFAPVGRHDRLDRAGQDARDPEASATRRRTGTSMPRRRPTATRSPATPSAASSCCNQAIMPICQYYAYIEILDEREMEVFSSEEAGRRAVARLSQASPRSGRISPPSGSPSRPTSSRSSTTCSRKRTRDDHPARRSSPTANGLSRRSTASSRRSRSIALKELKLDVYPNQIEIISTEQMLDAYSAHGHAADVSATGRSASCSRARRGSTARPYRPRLRDGDQLESLHLLSDGREFDDDADAGHRPRGLRPQSFLQEQLSLPAMDQRRRHSRISCLRQALHHGLRGTLRPRRGGARPRFGACADGPGRVPLPPSAAPVAGARAREAAPARGICRGRLQRVMAHPAAGESRRRRARSGSMDDEEQVGAAPKLPEENLLYFLEKNSPDAEVLAARGAAHRPPPGAVFLSAAPDQGDERGRGHLRAPHAS